MSFEYFRAILTFDNGDRLECASLGRGPNDSFIHHFCHDGKILVDLCSKSDITTPRAYVNLSKVRMVQPL
jgi:hypothetical protein